MINEVYQVQSSLFNLDSQFSCLDKLPEKLLPAVITSAGGELAERCESVAVTRTELLQGRVPTNIISWIPESAQNEISNLLIGARLSHYCYQNEEVTDVLLLDLLDSIERMCGQVTPLYETLIKQKEQEALEQIQQALEQRKKKPKRNKPISLTKAQLLRIAENANEEAWYRLIADLGLFSILPARWQDRLSVWKQLEDIFFELGLITGLGFDLSKGVFQSHGWLDMVRLNKVVKKLPKLQNLIQDLGRDEEADGTFLEEIVTTMRLVSRKEKYVTTPLVPMETKGITRSDSISRMLPQEASLLSNSILKKLWHAKRAEHGLLSYSVEGTEVLSVNELSELDVVTDKSGQRANKNRGPMVICLDTSGSMKGLPESIAKATVLECMKVAHKEKRRCYAFLFGSRDEVSELELTLDASGFNELLNFLTMSFGGGTDAEGPLNKALEKCDADEWYKSDILLVSDGEFSVSSGLSRKINNRREKQGLQLHGIQIGSGRSSMDRICDPLHHFSEWVELRKNKR